MENSVSTHISNGGRVVIPAEFRKSLGINEGEPITLSMDEFGIRISTPRLALKRLQALASKRVPKGKLLSEELIQERRKEAKRDLLEATSRVKKHK